MTEMTHGQYRAALEVVRGNRPPSPDHVEALRNARSLTVGEIVDALEQHGDAYVRICKDGSGSMLYRKGGYIESYGQGSDGLREWCEEQ